MAEPAAGRPVALVTGASGAIGTALLAHLAAAGHATVGTDLHDAPTPGVDVDLWCRADVTDAAQVDAAVATAVATFGRLDLLVANAGVTALGTFEQTSDEAFRRVVDVNLHGVVHTLRAGLPHLRATRGRIVVLSSVAGFAPVVGRPAYVASKHAVTGLAEALRHELRADGVGVTVVHPGFLSTAPGDVNAAAARSATGPELTADEVAAAVVRAVARGSDRVFPGRTATLSRLLHRLSPRLFATLMRARLDRA